MQCCHSTTYCFNLKFFFLFLWVKMVMNQARIKPVPDTAVICSVIYGFYLLTDDTCKSFLLPHGAFNKNIFQFLKTWFFWYYCCPELAPFCSGYPCS